MGCAHSSDDESEASYRRKKQRRQTQRFSNDYAQAGGEEERRRSRRLHGSGHYRKAAGDGYADALSDGTGDAGLDPLHESSTQDTSDGRLTVEPPSTRIAKRQQAAIEKARREGSAVASAAPPDPTDDAEGSAVARNPDFVARIQKWMRDIPSDPPPLEDTSSGEFTTNSGTIHTLAAAAEGSSDHRSGHTESCPLSVNETPASPPGLIDFTEPAETSSNVRTQDETDAEEGGNVVYEEWTDHALTSSNLYRNTTNTRRRQTQARNVY